MEKIINEARILVDAYENVQKARKSIANTVRNFERDHKIDKEKAEKIFSITEKELLAVEENIRARMEEVCLKIPVYRKFLSKVKGIGPTLSTKLITYIKDIGRFPRVSNLWSYAGLAPVAYCEKCGRRYFEDKEQREKWRKKEYEKRAKIIRERSTGNIKEKLKRIEEKSYTWICSCNDPKPKVQAERRRKGIPISYNPRMKSLMWVVATQFKRNTKKIKGNKKVANGYYRTLYEKYKEDEIEKNRIRTEEEKITKAHVDNRAMRRVAKTFLQHLWVVWREIEGLPVTEPYPKAYLNHEIDRVPDYKTLQEI